MRVPIVFEAFFSLPVLKTKKTERKKRRRSLSPKATGGANCWRRSLGIFRITSIERLFHRQKIFHYCTYPLPAAFVDLILWTLSLSAIASRADNSEIPIFPNLCGVEQYDPMFSRTSQRNQQKARCMSVSRYPRQALILRLECRLAENRAFSNLPKVGERRFVNQNKICMNLGGGIWA